MKAQIRITLKNGVLDPQGKAIQQAVHGLGIQDVHDVRQGKYIEVDLKENNVDKAKLIVDKMCRELLTNTIMENYSYELIP
ncbi:MAG: phosphoribosylformylglycinamidine synthase subunit PurS [Hyphomicrobium sp.]